MKRNLYKGKKKLVLILLWLKSCSADKKISDSTQIDKIGVPLLSSQSICTQRNLGYYISFTIKKGTNIAFHINSAQLGKNEFVDNGEGQKQFVMVPRGQDCYTLNTPD